MSRIGKKPITIPAKVEITIENQTVTVKGPKGQLVCEIHPRIAVGRDETGQIVVTRSTDERQDKALHGLSRALIANMVKGVSDGFRKTLLIEGVGYTADLRGKNLEFKLGYSHPIVIEPPEDIIFDVPKDRKGVVYVDGIDRQVVGQVAANIRELRPPEPYKGKGIRYEGEVIRRKAGKSGKGKK